MEIFKICGLAILSTSILLIAKQFKNDTGVVIRGAVSVMFLGVIVSLCIPIYKYVKELSELTLASEYTDVILKGVAIAFLVKTCSDVCKDLGEASIGGYIETIGRLELAVLAIPLIEKILKVIKDLL